MSPADLRRVVASASRALPPPSPPAADATVRHADLLAEHAVGIDDFRTGRNLVVWGGCALAAIACSNAAIFADLAPAMELAVGAAGVLGATSVGLAAHHYFERRISAWNQTVGDAIARNADCG